MNLSVMETKGRVITVIYALFLSGADAETRTEFFIINKGKPEARILLPRVFGKATLLAANELSDYIEKISGARIPVDLGKAQRLAGGIISLEPRTDPTSEVSADGSEDEFTIEERRNTLTIRGNSDEAVLYGVYQYLNELGVRWFMPGDLGENVPALKTIRIGNRKQTYKPSFRSRQIDYSGYNNWHFNLDAQDRQHRERDLWLLRNKCQFVRSIHWGAIHRYDFNWTREHSYHNLGFIIRSLDIGSPQL